MKGKGLGFRVLWFFEVLGFGFKLGLGEVLWG